MKTQVFVNREQEIESAKNFLIPDAEARIAIWEAEPASGLSTFLRHTRELLHDSGYVFYIDCSNKVANSIFSQLILTIFSKYRTKWNHFNRWLNREAGSGSARRIAEAGLEGMPWVGPALKQVSHEKNTPLDLSRFPSATAELVCRYLLQLRDERSVLLLLDNAQELDHWSLELFQTTTGTAYAGFNYLLFLVDRDEVAETDASLVRDKAIGISSFHDAAHFSPPSPQFVKELFTKYGQPISLPDAEMLVEASKANIYHILRALRKRIRSTKKLEHETPRLSPTSMEILNFLQCASQALRVSDVKTLVLSCPWLALPEATPFNLDENLNALEEKALVSTVELPDGDKLLQLDQTSTPGRLSSSLSSKLVTADHLFSYFTRVRYSSLRHSQAEVLPLLYRLAKVVEPSSLPALTQDLINLSQRMGSLEGAKRFVDLATIPRGSDLQTFSDLLAQTAFLLSVRQYNEARATLESVEEPHWRDQRLYSILMGITLNRCRHHRKSDELLTNLIDTADNLEECVLLLSYRIVGLLHANEVGKARHTFETWQERVGEAANYGYYLRNGASCYAPSEALRILTEAERVLRQRADEFGVATVQSNISTMLLEVADNSGALRTAEKAHSTLELFGVHHLHIAKNNLGLAQLFMAQHREAERSLKRSVAIARTAMPRIFSQINLAACYCLTDQQRAAYETVMALKDEVAEFPVDRVRQKYYVNAALILTLAGGAPDEINSMLEAALEYPDRMDEDLTKSRVIRLREAIKTGFVHSETFLAIFYPAYLVYWYQNPLEGLPFEILAQKTDI